MNPQAHSTMLYLLDTLRRVPDQAHIVLDIAENNPPQDEIYLSLLKELRAVADNKKDLLNKCKLIQRDML